VKINPFLGHLPHFTPLPPTVYSIFSYMSRPKTLWIWINFW